MFNVTENGGKSVAHYRVRANSNDRESSVLNKNEPLGIGMDLEARISKLEKEVARLKAVITRTRWLISVIYRPIQYLQFIIIELHIQHEIALAAGCFS